MKSIRKLILIKLLLLIFSNSSIQVFAINLLVKKDLSSISHVEQKLYNGKTFPKDTVLKRIQRLEIALFGEFSSNDKPVKMRVLEIENEIMKLEISQKPRRHHLTGQKMLESANRKDFNYEDSRYRSEQARSLREDRIRQELYQDREKQRNYALITPIFQNIFRSSMNALF